MAHSHVVSDSDTHFIIDPMTRAIKKEESAKVSLIVGDHNSERFSFELPRYIEGHDMSLCNVVRVHYMNTSSSNTNQQSVGVYEVDDFKIMSTDDSKMEFSWLISKNATMHVGKLAFTIQFACMTGYRVDYSWQSGVYSAMSISDGINGSEIVFDEYTDILQQWWLKLYGSSELPIKILTAEEFAALDGKQESGVLYLLEDDPIFTTIADHETRIANNTASITDYESRITNYTEQIAEHTTRIADHETLITNHIEQIADHEKRITNHTERIGEHTTQIADHETRITNNAASIVTHTEQISDHETRIVNHGTRIADHETWISNNINDINTLASKTSGFYDMQTYELIVDAAITPAVNNSFKGGLWLFEVSRSGDDSGGSVSVIMDTNCTYSSLFYFPYVSADTIVYRPAALKRTSLDSSTGNVTIRLVWFIPEEGTGAFFEEMPIMERILGRPFGFENGIG